MVKTIIKCAVAVLCTVAICVTIFVCTGKSGETAPDYMTEAQAAEYLGVSAERFEIMRKNLKYLEGAYVSYSYEENGERETVQISHEDMHKFDYVKEEIYYVYHKEHIDVEVYYSIRDIVWNVINKNMQALHHDDKNHTYSPHKLTPKEAMEILKGIAKEYKADEIYVSDDSVPFIMELLALEDKNVFIMGEN